MSEGEREDLGEPIGVYRGGKTLIVDLEKHRFPARCVLDNSTADIVSINLHQPLVDPRVGFGVLFALSTAALVTTGRATFLLGTAQRPAVIVGVSREKVDAWQGVAARGWFAVVLGFLLLFGSVAGYMYLAFKRQIPTADTFVLPLFPLGVALAVLGVLYLWWNDRKLLTLESRKGNLEWYSGAHPDFLASLPSLPTSALGVPPPDFSKLPLM